MRRTESPVTKRLKTSDVSSDLNVQASAAKHSASGAELACEAPPKLSNPLVAEEHDANYGTDADVASSAKHSASGAELAFEAPFKPPNPVAEEHVADWGTPSDSDVQSDDGAYIQNGEGEDDAAHCGDQNEPADEARHENDAGDTGRNRTVKKSKCDCEMLGMLGWALAKSAANLPELTTSNGNENCLDSQWAREVTGTVTNDNIEHLNDISNRFFLWRPKIDGIIPPKVDMNALLCSNRQSRSKRLGRQ